LLLGDAGRDRRDARGRVREATPGLGYPARRGLAGFPTSPRAPTATAVFFFLRRFGSPSSGSAERWRDCGTCSGGLRIPQPWRRRACQVVGDRRSRASLRVWHGACSLSRQGWRPAPPPPPHLESRTPTAWIADRSGPFLFSARGRLGAAVDRAPQAR